MYIDVARSRVARQLLFLPYKQGLPESANSAAGPGYILMQLPPQRVWVEPPHSRPPCTCPPDASCATNRRVTSRAGMSSRVSARPTNLLLPPSRVLLNHARFVRLASLGQALGFVGHQAQVFGDAPQCDGGGLTRAWLLFRQAN